MWAWEDLQIWENLHFARDDIDTINRIDADHTNARNSKQQTSGDVKASAGASSQQTSDQEAANDNSAASSSDESASAPVAPSSRRGRKQSLTEDPSKTFVCTLCWRRFRRQEHLKRVHGWERSSGVVTRE